MTLENLVSGKIRKKSLSPGRAKVISLVPDTVGLSVLVFVHSLSDLAPYQVVALEERAINHKLRAAITKLWNVFPMEVFL